MKTRKTCWHMIEATMPRTRDIKNNKPRTSILESVSGAALAASWLKGYQPERTIGIISELSTNYFPADSIAMTLETQLTYQKRDPGKIYVSKNYLYYCDSKKPQHKLASNYFPAFLKKKKKGKEKKDTKNQQGG